MHGGRHPPSLRLLTYVSQSDTAVSECDTDLRVAVGGGSSLRAIRPDRRHCFRTMPRHGPTRGRQRGIRGRDYTTSQERPKEHVHEEVSHFFSNLHSGAVGRCPGRPAARRCGAPPLRRSPACVRRAQASRAVVSGRSGGGRAAVVMDGSDGFKVKPMAGCQGLPWQ
jgi:hypothetical protein